jgi:deoxyribodipyrimidine photo-lyase
VLWFRRDLRLCDHPAARAAAAEAGADGVVPLFVVDPALWRPAGPPRTAWLVRSLRALDAALGGNLVVRTGDPAAVVPQVADDAGAAGVHVTADAGPYGRRRDEAVAGALAAAGRRLVRTGTPYAVGPGTVRSGSGEPYQVFTPFSRAWLAHGWPAPADRADGVRWLGPARGGLDGEPLPAEPDLGDLVLPEVGEAAALARWRDFLAGGLADYAQRRDRPDLEGTSGLSAHLKYGEVHPRTLLADLAALPRPDGRPGPAGQAGRGADVFRSELAWREFYADVLWHSPASAREDLRPDFARMRHDDPSGGPPAQRLAAWQQGRTGFPFVDAGMRQLLATGWMHNRVRMVVASFLVKDLHLQWQHGARWFMRWLRDGDLASNNHGWQWVAGSGTDAAPYFRVFNPVAQGLRFDPDGGFVRRYLPELGHLPAASAHQPWDAPDGYARGYPRRIVDHATERVEALARYESVRRPR